MCLLVNAFIHRRRLPSNVCIRAAGQRTGQTDRQPDVHRTWRETSYIAPGPHALSRVSARPHACSLARPHAGPLARPPGIPATRPSTRAAAGEPDCPRARPRARPPFHRTPTAPTRPVGPPAHSLIRPLAARLVARPPAHSPLVRSN